MNDASFGELRSLLHGTPSAAHFEAICELLRRTPEADAALRYTLEALESWPAASRRMPEAAIDEALEGRPTLDARLFRALELRERTLDVRALARVLNGPLAATLVELEIPDSHLGDGLVDVLAGAPTLMRRLRALTIADSGIGPLALEQLSQIDGLALERLNLSGNRLGVDALGFLFGRAERWPALEALVVDDTSIDDAACGALQGELLERLRVLSLRNNRIGDRGLAELVASGPAALRQLDLGGNPIGDMGVAALSGSALPALRDLDLSLLRFGAAGVDALRRQLAEQLERLVLRGIDLRQAGVTALAQGTWSSLVELDLSFCQIDGPGAEVVSTGSWTGSLRRLSLRGNVIADAGVDALSAQAWPALEAIDLGLNVIERPDALANAAWPALRELELWHNHIGDASLAALTRASWWPRLTTLGLKSNQLRGLTQLHSTQLRELVLDFNAIDARGLGRLREAQLPALRTLSMRFCGLSDDAADELRAAGLPTQLL